MLGLGLGLSQSNSFEWTNDSACAPFIKIPYTCDTVALEFSKYITACSCAFQNGDCFSPYFVLCQSSGSGKTRLLLEVSKYHPLIFINCKDVQDRFTSPGFQFLMDEVIDVNSIIKYMLETDRTYSQLAGWFDLYVSRKAYQVASFFEAISCCVFRHLLEVTSGEAFDLSILESKMREMTLMFFHYFASSKFWNVIIKSFKQNSFNIVALFEEQKNHPYLEYLRSKTVVTLAFDEASPFLKDDEASMQPSLAFRIIRRAAKMYEQHKFAYIMSGTTSKLANFCPPFIHDNSLREADTSFKLFPPFVLMYQDTLVPDYTRELMHSSNIYQTIQNREHDEDFHCLGRPLWKAIIGRSSLAGLIAFATTKLQDPRGTSHSLDWYVVVLIRAAMQLHPMYREAHDLVAGHMASMYAYLQEDHVHLASYISEPILAIAASNLMSKPDFRKKMLESLHSAINLENPNVGPRGEFVFQLYCMDVIDSITKYNPQKPVRLLDLLEGLFGAEIALLIQECSRNTDLTQCLVSIVQFKHLEYELDMDALKLGIIRGFGIVPKIKNHGFDLCIPFVLPNGEVSGLFIEIKNMSNEFTDSNKAIRLKEKADNISEKSIKIIVNCRRGERLEGCDFPIGNTLDVEKIVHVHYFCNGKNRFPLQYIAILSQSTRYKYISKIRSDIWAPFNKKYKLPPLLDGFLDLEISAEPFNPKSSRLLVKLEDKDIEDNALSLPINITKKASSPKKTTAKKMEIIEETVSLPAAGPKRKISEAKGKAPAIKKLAAAKATAAKKLTTVKGMAPAEAKGNAPAIKKPAAVKGKAPGAKKALAAKKLTTVTGEALALDSESPAKSASPKVKSLNTVTISTAPAKSPKKTIIIKKKTSS